MGKRKTQKANKNKTLPKGRIEQHYLISTNVLGSGAYASVFLGRCLNTGESVAIKRIEKGMMKHRDMEKLHKEVKILKSLRHDNVVQVYDSFDTEQFYYIVMEYISGGELFKRIVQDDYKFSEKECQTMIITLLSALKYCKDKGVVHRDLKPENILFTAEDQVKIVDFNLSKQVDVDNVEFNFLETMCGTPNYVAPEVISGTPYNYKCDIWSMGVISFLVLSGGFLPFFVNNTKEGENARAALLRKVRDGKWGFSPQSAWAPISDLAKNFVSKMLVVNPDERYTYEQLLAHPWLKSVQGAATLGGIVGAKMNEEILRKFRSTIAVQTAVEEFKNIMTDEHEVENIGLHNNDFGNSGVQIFDSLDDPYGI